MSRKPGAPTFTERVRSHLSTYSVPGAAAREAVDFDLACSEIARATPVYVIGDSLSLIFHDRVYRAGEGDSARHYVARARYCPGLRAGEFTGESGNFHPAVEAALRAELLLVDGDDGAPVSFHRTASRGWRTIAAIEGRARSSPVLLFVCGSLDMAQILQTLRTQDGRERPLSLLESKREAARCAEPFERGLRALSSLGFDRVFVHSVVPPQRDDAAFRDHFDVAASLETRRRLLGDLNAALARTCERARCTFIDMWDYTTAPSGLLERRFAHDSFHFNARAAMLAMQAILRRLHAPGEPE